MENEIRESFSIPKMGCSAANPKLVSESNMKRMTQLEDKTVKLSFRNDTPLPVRINIIIERKDQDDVENLEIILIPTRVRFFITRGFDVLEIIYTQGWARVVEKFNNYSEIEMSTDSNAVIYFENGNVLVVRRHLTGREHLWTGYNHGGVENDPVVINEKIKTFE